MSFSEPQWEDDGDEEGCAFEEQPPKRPRAEEEEPPAATADATESPEAALQRLSAVPWAQNKQAVLSALSAIEEDGVTPTLPLPCADGGWATVGAAGVVVVDDRPGEFRELLAKSCRRRVAVCLPPPLAALLLRRFRETTTRLSALVAVAVAVSAGQSQDADIANFVRQHAAAVQRFARHVLPPFVYGAGAAVAERVAGFEAVRCSALATTVQFDNGPKTRPEDRAAALVGSRLYFLGALPKPFVPLAVFTELSRLFTASGARSEPIERLLLALASSSRRAEADALLADVPAELPESEPRWCVRAESVGTVSFVEPAAVFDSARPTLPPQQALPQPLWRVSVFSIPEPTQLTQGEDLSRFRLRESTTDEAMRVGRLGEEIAKKFLQETVVSRSPGALLSWPDEEVATTLPYDLFVRFRNGDTHYYEVKATTHSALMRFRISAGELEFAMEHREKYHILRVLRVNSPDVTVVQLNNPLALARAGRASIVVEPFLH